MRKKSKAKCETAHFKKRCKERVEGLINRKEIERAIRAHKLPFLDKKSNRVSRFIYEKDGVDYVVVYDRNTHKAVTIYKRAG